MSVHRRNLLRILVHFVFTTHNRLPLITDVDERELYRYIESICQELHCGVLALNGMPDHVHLLVALPGDLSTATLMKRVKGSSSRFMSTSVRPGEWFAWRPNYAALSVCDEHKDAVIRYIHNQKRHHVTNTTISRFEDIDEPAPSPRSG